MFSIDLWFVFICKFSLVVLVMLVPGALALRFIKQPIERIRLIQIS